MFIISNTNTIIEHLDTPELVDKYQCRFRIKTEAGTQIYFTNVECKGDIELKNFTCIAKLNRSDTYVLAPDTIDQERLSYLIIFVYQNNHKFVGIKQRILFDFYTHCPQYTQIVALGRDFPETFDSTEYIMSVHTEYKDVVYDILIRRTNRFDIQCNGYHSRGFVMFGQYTQLMHSADMQRPLLHPITKFVIDSDNVIFVPEGMTNKEICDFLNLDEIPQGVAIHWLSDVRMTRMIYIETILRKLKRDNRHKVKFILLGFDYLFTAYTRKRISEFYNW